MHDTRSISALAIRQDNPAATMCSVLEECVRSTRAAGGRLYVFNSRRGRLLLHHEVNSPPCQGEIDLPQVLSDIRHTSGAFGQHLVYSSNLASDPRNLSGMAFDDVSCRISVAIYQEISCVGILEVDYICADESANKHRVLLEVAADTLVLLSEKRATANLLHLLQEPVDFRTPFDVFVSDLVSLASRASSMKFVVLRELVGGNVLRCLASLGFDGVTVDRLDLDPVSNFSAFERAIGDNVSLAVSDVSVGTTHSVALPEGDAGLKSFVVVPIRVGSELFGTISFGSAHPHAHTQSEIQRLDAVSNYVGLTLANGINIHRAETAIYNEARVGASIAAVEVAQAVRHEARNHLTEVQERLALITGLVSREKTTAKHVKDSLEIVSRKLVDVGFALERMKAVSRPPKRQLSKCSLAKLCHEVGELVIGQMAALNVGLEISGEALAEVYEEYLRHVFLNLIFNSLEAFRERGTKRNRLIRILIKHDPGNKGSVALRYIDNAGGVDFRALASSSQEPFGAMPNIFDAGVTSKPDGSGYGLFLVRRMIDDHGGSIDLIDNKGGVVFEILLPATAKRKSNSK